MTYVFETVDGAVTVKHNKHMFPDEAISVMIRNRHGDFCDVNRKQHAGLMRKLVDALYKTHDTLIPRHVLNYDAILEIVGGTNNEGLTLTYCTDQSHSSKSSFWVHITITSFGSVTVLKTQKCLPIWMGIAM